MNIAIPDNADLMSTRKTSGCRVSKLGRYRTSYTADVYNQPRLIGVALVWPSEYPSTS